MRHDPALAGQLVGTLIRDVLASLEAARKVPAGEVMLGARLASDGSIERTELREDTVRTWVEQAPDRLSVLFRRSEELVVMNGVTYPDGTNTMIAGDLFAIVPDAASGDTILSYGLGYGWSFDDVTTSTPEVDGSAARVARTRFADTVAEMLRREDFIAFGALGALDDDLEN